MRHVGDEPIADDADGPLTGSRRSFSEMMANMKTSAATELTTQEISDNNDHDSLDDRVWTRLSSIIDYFDVSQLRSEDPDVTAYLATRVFEWEVGNGGLHQYFFNFAFPEHLEVVLDGYTTLGLHETRRTIAGAIAPVAQAEQTWRESNRGGTIEEFFDSYVATDLSELDDLIEFHDAERIDLVRTSPEKFAR